MFTVELERENGERFEVLYNHRTSELKTPDGDDVVMPDDTYRTFDTAKSFTPEKPIVGKSKSPARLKIQMGLKCNYSCSYCSQATHIGEGIVSNVDDAVDFMVDLDSWLEGSPSSIELWGGEPLVYWKMIKYLVPELRARFPEAKLSFITNGSLLNDEKVEFIKDYNIIVAMSHDGPGQHVRGDDPFDNPEVLRCVRRLVVERRRFFTINSVISVQSPDVNKTVQWFADNVHPDIVVSFEGIVETHGNDAGEATTFDVNTYQIMMDSVKRNIHDRDIVAGGLNRQVTNFMDTILSAVPATYNGQKCGMDRQDVMAIDLKGNVMTCQNTGAVGEHGIGNVHELEKVKLDTAWHWSERPDCDGCPYLQICKGACMFLSGDDWVETCENNYHYSKAIFEAVIERLVGAKVVGFRGHHTRPKKREHAKIDIVELT